MLIIYYLSYLISNAFIASRHIHTIIKEMSEKNLMGCKMQGIQLHHRYMIHIAYVLSKFYFDRRKKI